ASLVQPRCQRTPVHDRGRHQRDPAQHHRRAGARIAQGLTRPSEDDRALEQPPARPMSATNRMHWVVFAAALAAFLVWPFGGFDSIHGDNICQVAYWRVLLHPHLVGAIGASSPKLGITLVLGLTYDLSDLLFHSTVLIRVVLAIFAAVLVSSTARIAGDLAGPTAAALAAAYLVWGTPMAQMFVGGTSMVFFLPLFLSGVRQFAQGRPTRGAAFLGCSSLFRIESIFVLAWLAISEGLFRRRWRLFWTCAAIMG